MSENERDLVFSESVKAGKRIYYFDVKQTRNGDRYVSITESKKVVDGSYDNPRVSFEKHKLFLYKEDYEKFVSALLRTIDVAKTNIIPSDELSMAQNPNAETSMLEVDAAEGDLSHSVSAISPSEAIPSAKLSEEKPAAAISEGDEYKIDLDF